jgi:protein SCO1/2
MFSYLRTGPGRPPLALAAILLAATAAPAQDGLAPAGGADRPNPKVGYEQKLGDKVPLDLRFVREDGADVSLGDCVGGKPTILILAYYRCPQLCGEVFAGVLDAARAMSGRGYIIGKEFNVVCVSFDPKEHADLALAKKRRFVTEYGRKEADEGWRFLTGKQPAIDRLTTAVGFSYEFDKMLKLYNHVSGIIILTPEGVIARYFPGIEYLDRGDNGQLTADPSRTLRLSLVEAGEGQIGTLSDRVFLTCYFYSPHQGKYSLQVLAIMRTGGFLTLLLIALVYAWKAWKVPGVRVMVVGILAYLAAVPLIMFGQLPKAEFAAVMLAVALVVIVVGRRLWRAAKAREARSLAQAGAASAPEPAGS